MIRVPLACLLYLALSSVTSQCAEPAPQETSTGKAKAAAATDLESMQSTLDKVEADKAALLKSVEDKARKAQADYEAFRKFIGRNAPWVMPGPVTEADDKPAQKPVEPVESDAPVITIPAKVTGKRGQWIKITATTNGGEVRWVSLTEGLSVFPTELLRNTLTGVVLAPEDGEYRVLAYTALGNVPSDPVECLVVVGNGPRPPPPDPDDDDTDPPDPPEPPIPAPTGFRVLFISESSANHTREQINTLRSTAIADYLNRKCVKDASGRAEWRSWDKDVTLTAKESQALRDLWEKVKPQLGTLPQVVIVTNGKGQLFNLPATEAETLALLKKHGGE